MTKTKQKSPKSVRFPEGLEDRIPLAAEKRGMTVNAYIVYSVNRAVLKDLK